MTNPGVEPINPTQLVNCEPHTVQTEFTAAVAKVIKSGEFPIQLYINDIGPTIFREETSTREIREASEEGEACVLLQGGQVSGADIPTSVEIVMSDTPSGVGFLGHMAARGLSQLFDVKYPSDVNLFRMVEQAAPAE